MEEKSPEHDGATNPAHPHPVTNDDAPRQDPTMLGRHSLQITQGHRVAISPQSGADTSKDVNKPDLVLDEKKARSLHNLNTANSPIHPAPISPTHRKTRPSHDFDRRYDGPFGRPSLAMTRRSSLSPTRSPRHSGVSIRSPRLSTTRPASPVDEGAPSRPTFQPTPPPLNYTLRTRKLAIFLFWTLILFDSIAMPIALYFGLWYGVGPGTNTATEKKEKLTPNAVFSIVTAAVGGASIVEYFLRFWRLWRKGSTCRVIGAHRWYLDWFHWNFSFAWIIIMIELIVGTVPEHPPIRLLSMPVTTMLFVFGTELLLVDTMRYFHVPAPCRISSIPKGAQLRPGIYSLIEDICAVDGSGGTEFRVALDRRYEASHVFRAMLRRLGVFWAVGAEACAVLCTVLIFTLDGDVAYTIGWSLPFVWAGIWTGATFCTFGEPYEEHEVCPAAGSCVNMQSGPDGWAQKANWVILKGSSCVRFYNEYNCTGSAKTWEPTCQSVDWSSYILQDWQNGVMKSYTVWKQ
ncbi:hypothetical protein CGCA056_v000084 [Colletotrichum aenigma]|uniref:uncharacterized protein n=1 Tax=Colletotrichum aenigma TaxID=1215731 RepID=UPI001873331A|nr:uncharacterized protein CGCA056_v000084 [Colletotrichum aenigma]KAF5528534.1 hypothetical protein CGCA056_v000084 [Colletotrichum aenigma]